MLDIGECPERSRGDIFSCISTGNGRGFFIACLYFGGSFLPHLIWIIDRIASCSRIGLCILVMN